MSGMADEMSRRLQDDGGAGLPEGGGAAPGSDGGSQAAPAAPPAGASNTDTAVGNGAPDTIPYARFKEVNDNLNSLKGFEPLVEYGYDPDSLGRLAAFEQQYIQDPVGTWATMADNIDLPQDLKDAVARHVESVSGDGASGAGRAGGEPSGDGQAQELKLPEDVQKRLEYVDRMQEREAEAERNAQLDAVISHWDSLDKQDGIDQPTDPGQREEYRALQFRMVAAMAGSGQQFATVEDLAEAARKPVLGYRSSVLGGAVRTGRAGAPLAVPGGASSPAGPVKFGSIREATKAAEAAMARGELPEIKQ